LIILSHEPTLLATIFFRRTTDPLLQRLPSVPTRFGLFCDGMQRHAAIKGYTGDWSFWRRNHEKSRNISSGLYLQLMKNN